MPFAAGRFRSAGPRDFDEALRELKRGGCTLLVTGDVPGPVTLRVSRRLLGDPARDRKRLLAFVGRAPESVEEYLPADVERDDPDMLVIGPDGFGDAGGASAPESRETAAGAGGSDLDRLREELVNAVSVFDEGADGLEPAELRVGIGSIERALADAEPTAVKRFVRAVSAAVRGVGGMAHVHLPRPDDSPRVREMRSLFDARIELRKRRLIDPEQRWHLHRHGLTSDWTRL